MENQGQQINSNQMKIYAPKTSKNEYIYVQKQNDEQRINFGQIKVEFQNVIDKDEDMQFLILKPSKYPPKQFEKMIQIFKQIFTKDFVQKVVPKLKEIEVKGRNNNALDNAIKNFIENYDPETFQLSSMDYNQQVFYYSIPQKKQSQVFVYYRVFVPSQPEKRQQKDFAQYLIKNEIIVDIEGGEKVPVSLSKPKDAQKNFDIIYNICLEGKSYDSFYVKTQVKDFAKEREQNYTAIWYYDYQIKKGKNPDGLAQIKIELAKSNNLENLHIFRIVQNNQDIQDPSLQLLGFYQSDNNGQNQQINQNQLANSKNVQQNVQQNAQQNAQQNFQQNAQQNVQQNAQQNFQQNVGQKSEENSEENSQEQNSQDQSSQDQNLPDAFLNQNYFNDNEQN